MSNKLIAGTPVHDVSKYSHGVDIYQRADGKCYAEQRQTGSKSADFDLSVVERKIEAGELIDMRD